MMCSRLPTQARRHHSAGGRTGPHGCGCGHPLAPSPRWGLGSAGGHQDNMSKGSHLCSGLQVGCLDFWKENKKVIEHQEK